MKKLILFYHFLLLSYCASAQLSIGYFPIQSEISITSNSERAVWGDLRIASNTFFGNITTEPIIMANFKKKEVVNYYGGIGMNLNFFNAFENISIINGYNLHFGARVKPINKLNSVQFIFEVSPYMNRYFDGGILRTRMGIAYQFTKKKKSP